VTVQPSSPWLPAWIKVGAGHDPALQRMAQSCWMSRTCQRREACTFSGKGVVCGLERHTIHHVWQHLPPSATVLELGSRFGTVSCGISMRQSQSGLRLSLEPDARAFASLTGNTRANSCNGTVLHGALSSVPLWQSHRRTPTGSERASDYDNHLTATNCTGLHLSQRTCQRVNTYRPAQLAGILSEAVGRAVRFDALVVDCEGCFTSLVSAEEQWLRDPALRVVFYEADEGQRSRPLIRRMCEYGFGVVVNEIDCLLPRGGKAQIVFERRAGLPCQLTPRASARCPDD